VSINAQIVKRPRSLRRYRRRQPFGWRLKSKHDLDKIPVRLSERSIFILQDFLDAALAIEPDYEPFAAPQLNVVAIN
jgi:hypothetical protein